MRRALLAGALLAAAGQARRLRIDGEDVDTIPLDDLFAGSNFTAEGAVAAAARRLQTTAVGEVIVLPTTQSQRSLGTGSTATFSWQLVDSTLAHTVAMRDWKTGLIASGNNWQIRMGVSSSLSWVFTEGSFQCCSGSPCTCRTYNIRSGGNRNDVWAAKQAQGYGQGASYVYMQLQCKNRWVAS